MYKSVSEHKKVSFFYKRDKSGTCRQTCNIIKTDFSLEALPLCHISLGHIYFNWCDGEQCNKNRVGNDYWTRQGWEAENLYDGKSLAFTNPKVICQLGFEKKGKFYDVQTCARMKSKNYKCIHLGYNQCMKDDKWIGCAIDKYSCSEEMTEYSFKQANNMLKIL